jgi:hypothetical protein
MMLLRFETVFLSFQHGGRCWAARGLGARLEFRIPSFTILATQITHPPMIWGKDSNVSRERATYPSPNLVPQTGAHLGGRVKEDGSTENNGTKPQFTSLLCV